RLRRDRQALLGVRHGPGPRLAAATATATRHGLDALERRPGAIGRELHRRARELEERRAPVGVLLEAPEEDPFELEGDAVAPARRQGGIFGRDHRADLRQAL